MAPGSDRTVHIIKPDTETILKNIIKSYFETLCQCKSGSGVESVRLHQNGDIAVVFSNTSGQFWLMAQQAYSGLIHVSQYCHSSCCMLKPLHKY